MINKTGVKEHVIKRRTINIIVLKLTKKLNRNLNKTFGQEIEQITYKISFYSKRNLIREWKKTLSNRALYYWNIIIINITY